MRTAFPVAAPAYALALLAGAVSLWVTGAGNAGFSGADEPAHFLNAWFVSLYGREALGQDPIAFATEFYLHYPKISIGHWPPAYYALISPVFMVLPPAAQTAFAVNLVVAALPAVGVALALNRLAGRWAAVAGAVLWALTPLTLEGFAFFMLDQPLAALTLTAALVWSVYANSGKGRHALAFALLAAAAVLVKGNGWLLVFVPPLHMALTKRWVLLACRPTWGAAAVAVLIVVPWYAATAGISAEGFNYRPGPAYAAKAFAFNVQALALNLGPALALAGYGGFVEWRRRDGDEPRWSLVSACLALVIATLLLQSLVPVDLDPRYMAPAMPGLVILAALGGVHLLPRLSAAPAAAATALLLTPGAVHLATRAPKADLRMEEVARDVAGAWAVDGGSAAEGAFIAAMAVRDPALSGYALRGSKLLAESDFMGRLYRPRFRTEGEVLGELRRLGLAGIVLSLRDEVRLPPHSLLLHRALRSPGSGYRLAAVYPYRNRPGATEVYRAERPVVANVAAIRAIGLPSKLELAEARR